MVDTELVAQELASAFFKRGSYTLSSERRSGSLLTLPAAASDRAGERLIVEAGFAGLAVHSVGYEKGATDPHIHIYVTKGRESRNQKLETPEGTVLVDVNRIGKVVVKPEAAAGTTDQGRLYTRKNRIACGSSCAPAGERYSGTLGALARKKKDPSQLFVLSNNHVLAAGNHIPVGMPIMAPSNADAGPGLRAPGEVARHADICELRSGEPTLVPPCSEDLALAAVTDPKQLTSWQGRDSDGYDTPAKVSPLSAGMRVKKVGRTTGLTLGTVEAALMPFAMPYKCTHFTATVWFQNVWTVRADPDAYFALGGDSGSLVVMEDGSAAVGIVFAAPSSGEYGIIVPMTHVVTCFGGLELATKHGI